MKIKLDKGAYAPVRAHRWDAGLDLRSPVDVIVLAKNSTVINTGVHMEIPAGYVGFLKSKSGLNVKHGLTTEGVIDCGYTGAIVVKVYNLSKTDYIIHRGDKITQLVLLPVYLGNPDEIVDELEATERGDDGFGSTGK